MTVGFVSAGIVASHDDSGLLQAVNLLDVRLVELKFQHYSSTIC